MFSLQDAQKALKDFGDSCQVTDLTFDEDGYCALPLDDGLTIHLQYDEQKQNLICSAEIGHLPSDQPLSLAILRRLMGLNLNGQGSIGTVIGLDEANDSAVVQERLDCAYMSEDALHTFLNSFDEKIVYLQDLFAHLPKEIVTEDNEEDSWLAVSEDDKETDSTEDVSNLMQGGLRV